MTKPLAALPPAAATESRAALAENALAACVEALTRRREHLAAGVCRDEGEELAEIDAAIARARAPGRVVASVEGLLGGRGRAAFVVEHGDEKSLIWVVDIDEHPALAAPVDTRVRVFVVAEPGGEKGTP